MKRKCGVNKSLFKKYEFEEHIWSQNAPNYDDLLHLAHRCVKINGCYWMKKVGSNSWITLSNITDAKNEAFNTWLGGKLPSGKNIDAALIETFFTGIEYAPTVSANKMKFEKVNVGSCPNIFQKMVVPMGTQFVTYTQQAYLNTWYDDMLCGDNKQLDLGKLILVMIYGALCNGKINKDKDSIAVEADRIYSMVLKNEYDNVEFRYLINWLAAIVQNPGINLQTNIWLIGELEGLGKGTLIDVMRHILGAEFVGELNQTEIEAGWNDHLVGKQLVEVNEFDSSGKMSGQAWGKWLKNHTIEPTFKVRQRNTTSYTVLHIGNFIGTSNNIEQTFIDANDRRNQFINTASDPFWVNFATGIQLKYFKRAPKEIAAGFAYILEQVKVDMNFISKSFKNQLRQNMVSNRLNIIEEWLEYDPTIEKDKWINSAPLYEDYKIWFRTNHPSESVPSIHAFGKAMTKSLKIGVLNQTTRSARQYMFSKAVEVVPAKLEDAVDSINHITGSTEEVVVYDLDEKQDKTDFSHLTPLEKMRAHLMKQESEERLRGKN